MTHRAKKIVFITERLILDGVLKIVEREGATGYTVSAAGGKGSRQIRAENRAHVVEAFSNVQVDVIVPTAELAERIAEAVAAAYFENYSGITYIQDVEVLRPHKFGRPIP